jgi:hypothetical protein
MSAAGRARIAAAQRARWAKVKGQKVVSIAAPKRTMSPAARRRRAPVNQDSRNTWFQNQWDERPVLPQNNLWVGT